MSVPAETPDDLIAIDDALRALTAQYERKGQVVDRFSGGLSVEEGAEVLQISRKRDEGLDISQELADARAGSRKPARA